MKHYQQPEMRIVDLELQDVLLTSGNPDWQDDPFAGGGV